MHIMHIHFLKGIVLGAIEEKRGGTGKWFTRDVTFQEENNKTIFCLYGETREALMTEAEKKQETEDAAMAAAYDQSEQPLPYAQPEPCAF